MADLTLAKDMTLILAAAFIGGIVALRFKQPPLIGYILGGLTIGSYSLGIIKGPSVVSTLADIGIAFLMFSIGLEFSFKRLTHVKNIAIFGALLQMISFTAVGLIVLPIFGFTRYEALFLSSLFSLSSTAVVVKVLGDKGELDTLPSEIMLGWLLVQDLAVLPLMILLPAFAHVDSNLPLVLLNAIIKVAIFLTVFLVLGRILIPIFLDKAAATKTRELLLLSVISLCLAAAFATYSLGLSFALGAFLAGAIVAESLEHNVIFSEIRPLRDIFVIVFFVSLGMLIDPGMLFNNGLLIIAFVVCIILIKFLISFLTTLFFGYHSKTAFWVGMGLVQVGEFSFVLAKIGQENNLIGTEIYQIILSVALISIFLTPWLIQMTPKIYHLPFIHKNLFARFDTRPNNEIQQDLQDHVIICGYGRIGGHIAKAMEMEKIPFMVIDYNHGSVKELRKNGINALYGDLSNIDLLDNAQVSKAKAVIVAVPELFLNALILKNVKERNKDVTVICRAHHDEDERKLYELGADSVIEPEFEASLLMAQKALVILGKNKDTTIDIMRTLRREHKKENGNNLNAKA